MSLLSVLSGHVTSSTSEHRKSDAMRLQRPDDKKPCIFHLVHWNTHSRNPELPCRKLDYSEAGWLERLCV